MKVILLADVKGQGKKNDVIEVSDGYGKNFLIPRKLAKVAEKPISDEQLHEEQIAAITAALKLYKSALHDRESEVLTIMSAKRAYSPWNSKIHGLTQLPDRK